MARDKLIFVDVGISDAREWWNRIVVPSVESFQEKPSIQTGMASASSLWHTHEWIWYDQHPNENTWKSQAYKDFCTRIMTDCPELDWLHDLTNIGKHRGLTRSAPSDVSVVKQDEIVGRGGAGGYGVKRADGLRFWNSATSPTSTERLSALARKCLQTGIRLLEAQLSIKRLSRYRSTFHMTIFCGARVFRLRESRAEMRPAMPLPFLRDTNQRSRQARQPPGRVVPGVVSTILRRSSPRNSKPR